VILTRSDKSLRLNQRKNAKASCQLETAPFMVLYLIQRTALAVRDLVRKDKINEIKV